MPVVAGRHPTHPTSAAVPPVAPALDKPGQPPAERDSDAQPIEGSPLLHARILLGASRLTFSAACPAEDVDYLLAGKTDVLGTCSLKIIHGILNRSAKNAMRRPITGAGWHHEQFAVYVAVGAEDRRYKDGQVSPVAPAPGTVRRVLGALKAGQDRARDTACKAWRGGLVSCTRAVSPLSRT